MSADQLSARVVNSIVRMAWEDRTTFEAIESATGFTEAEVIKLMRRELKPSSFRRWRKRVTGRLTKHRKKFERRMEGDSMGDGQSMSTVESLR